MIKREKNLPNVAQAKPKITTRNLTMNNARFCLARRIILQATRATSNGKIQYPRTHTLWKNELKYKNICEF